MEQYEIHKGFTAHKSLYHRFGKRLLSILLALIAMPFVLLSCLIFGPIIKLTDGGTVFYRSARLGLNGKVFYMLKFRSMHMNAGVIRQKDGVTTSKDDNDPRVTHVGRFMRKFGVDELPQIFNVLMGDMSFIGPRPDLTDTIDRLTGKIPNPLADITPENFYEDYYAVRMSVRPGITCYGPVFLPRGTDRVKKDMVDAWYAQKMSLALDIKVLWGTACHLLGGKHK